MIQVSGGFQNLFTDKQNGSHTDATICQNTRNKTMWGKTATKQSIKMVHSTEKRRKKKKTHK